MACPMLDLFMLGANNDPQPPNLGTLPHPVFKKKTRHVSNAICFGIRIGWKTPKDNNKPFREREEDSERSTGLCGGATREEVDGEEMIITGDCREMLKTLGKGSVQTCVTSPPYYGLRDYGHAEQIGLEGTPEQYVASLVEVFRGVREVLRDDGTLWLNLGDSYNNSCSGGNGATGGRDKSTLSSRMPPIGTTPIRKNKEQKLHQKNILGIPWRVAFALQSDGWILRQDIIWHKKNPMPESVTDRCTKAHEYIFLLSKSPRYYFNADAIKEETVTKDVNLRDRETTKLNNTPGRTRMSGLIHNDYDTRNKRSVWSVASQPYVEAHFATFPPDLIEPCILAGAPEGGVVLDPFNGSGTTGLVAMQWKREYIGIELNPEYVALTQRRLAEIQTEMFA